jgi:glycosyltransferase involved in cell wall biosynthesis
MEKAKTDGTLSRLEIRGYVSEEEKADLYAKSLGVYFGAYQEDYGYITLESFYSGKPVIIHTDSGGPAEFVNESNGFIIRPEPQEIARVMDSLYNDREHARDLGDRGYDLMQKLNITWDYVIGQLVS